MKITIDSEELGEEFYLELEKLISVRKKKKKIYGNTYLSDELIFLVMQCQNKLKRLQLHIENKTEINDIEKAEDNCIDLCIYALFLSANLKKK